MSAFGGGGFAADRSAPTALTVRDLQRAHQLLSVTVADWSGVSAQIRCFERSDVRSPWKPSITSSAVVGRNGLAWGLGLHDAATGTAPMKKEGDGKAPAGVFRLIEAFGFAPPEEAQVARFPYRHLSDSMEAIDDAASRHYNRIVDAASIAAKDWKSSERMRRIEPYRWGAVVGHNSNRVTGAGSCIFLHVWEGAGIGTSGCTAMPEGQMLRVLQWLDRTKNPVLVQLPDAEYQRLKTGWKLP